MKRAVIVASLSLGLLGATVPALAQEKPLVPATQGTQGIKRTPLQKFEVPGTGYDTVIGLAEIAANTNIGRHSHPGVESGYVLEGTFTLLVEGQPPKDLKAGESYQIPPGAIHDAKSGAAPAKVIATYVVERGKPLAIPAK
ncbi:MAG: cupin domain-containing protein [Proteobacteria bacterium]|nr:cupin domain-containing protein [Pseudomonadota bacterium]